MKGFLKDMPWASKFLIFFGILLIGGYFFQIVGFSLTNILFPKASFNSFLTNFDLIKSSEEISEHQIAAMKFFQFFSATGQYILTPLFFIYLCDFSLVQFTGLHKKLSIHSITLILFIFFSSIGLIAYINEWNQKIQLPDSMNSIQTWARSIEDQATLQIDAILNTSSVLSLIINILIVALLAAIGEELVFRGLIQNMLYKWTNKLHLSVWLAASIFSFMHFQFFGFFPRLILGAVLGYLFIWSENLWAPILGHFINNFLGVLAYYLVSSGTIEENVTETSSLLYAAVCLPFLLLFMFLYRRMYVTKTI